MISVKCPNCGRAHPAEKEVLGKKVRCEDCGFAFVARKEKLDKITVSCPNGGTEHQAPQAVEGKRIRCNDCAHQFVAADKDDRPPPGPGPLCISPPLIFYYLARIPANRNVNNRFAVWLGTMGQGDSQPGYDRFIQKVNREIQRAKTGPQPPPT